MTKEQAASSPKTQEDATPTSAPAEPPRLADALRAPTLGDKVAQLGAWWAHTRLARMLARYNGVSGNLISSGMALTALLSLTAALTVLVTVFLSIIGDNQELRTAFFDAIAHAIPSLIQTADNPNGMVSPDDFVMTGAVSLTGIIALTIMAWSAIGVIGQLANSIRKMFAIPTVPDNPVIQILRNALGALGLAFSIILGAGLGIVVDLGGQWILGAIGLSSGPVATALLKIASYVVAFVVYALVTWLLIWVVARVHPPRKDLIWGLAIISVASIVLRILGTSAVSASSSPLLAAGASIITLILWINLQMRAFLMACAWTANPPAPSKPAEADEVHFTERPNYITCSDPRTLLWPHHPISGEVRPDPLYSASRDLEWQTIK